MNLLETLLSFAYGKEDPITEMLAWFLRSSPALRARVLDAFDVVLLRRGARLPRGQDGTIAEPAFLTQVVAPNANGTDCRYDLVCDWHAPRVRLIIEIKIWAGLTWGIERSADDGSTVPSHQVSRYLAVAAASPEIRTHVVVLAPYNVELGGAASDSGAFAGQMTWQIIHDAFARSVAADEHARDPTMARLALEFVRLLENQRMSVPKLTFDVLTSVSRYRRFEKSVRMMLTHARDNLVGEGGALNGWFKGDSRAWEDDHDRLGWRVWLDAKDSLAFAFVGAYVGSETLHEDIPDLYFFLQVRKGSDAQKRLDENADAIRPAVESFTSDTTRGYYRPGEWVTIGIRRSLVEVARAADPTDATTSFFRECVTSPRGKELLDLYQRAVRQPSRVTTSDEGVA